MWIKDTEKDPKESILGGGVTLAETLGCVPETLKEEGQSGGHKRQGDKLLD